MNKKQIGTLILGLLIIVLIAAAFSLLREPEAASSTLEAIPLTVDESTLEAATTEPETSAGDNPTAVPAESDGSEAAAENGEAETAGAALQVFSINASGSEVRFELDEDLRGTRKTVVGVTDQVAGEFAFDLSDLSTAQVGVIQINARTLVTDNEFRNRAIKNQILDTDNYEFITFTPTAITGLPDSAAVGDQVSFTIEGDLKIFDISIPTQFEVTAAVVSEAQVSGTAAATVSREAYGIKIPSVPNVANVENEVDLVIEFTADAAP